MASDPSIPEASAPLGRIEEKLDRLTDEVGEIKGAVVKRDTFCEGEHRRVDEKLKEDRARIVQLEGHRTEMQAARSWTEGAGFVVVKLLALAGGSGGVAALVMYLLGAR